MKFLCCLILILPCIVYAKTQEWKRVVYSLSAEEHQVLEMFFRSLFTDLSFGGYVLYGNKPVFIEGFVPEETIVKYVDERIDRPGVCFKEGISLWKKLGFDKYCKNYFIRAYEKPCYNWLHLVLINKKEFVRVVNQNLPLFQYILSPKIDAENLFSQLMNEKQSFESVIKYSSVLEGILFGFGTQNAIQYTRKEKLDKDLKASTQLPFKSKRLVRNPNEFSTPEKELAWLENKTVISNSFNENKSLPLPWFGCYDSQESAELIKQYKQAQKKIQRVLESDHFLEEVLTKFFE